MGHVTNTKEKCGSTNTLVLSTKEKKKLMLISCNFWTPFAIRIAAHAHDNGAKQSSQ